MTQMISISRDGIWAGSGRIAGESIVDCPAILGETQEDSDNTYEQIMDAIENGETSIDVGEHCYTWTIESSRLSKAKLMYMTSNGGDRVILVLDGVVRSDWGVTPEVLADFCTCTTDAADWDDRFGNEHKPEDYGDAIAERDGYSLIMLDEDRWRDRLGFVLGIEC